MAEARHGNALLRYASTAPTTHPSGSSRERGHNGCAHLEKEITMAKIDTLQLAQAFAEAERMNDALGVDHDGMTVSTLRILAADIAGRVKSENPRFKIEQFEIDCFPLATERRRQAIIAALAEDSDIAYEAIEAAVNEN
jgi:hypothetical protein